MNLKRLREIDWEAIAGIVAAVTALVLHLLHIADEALLLTIALVVLAVALVRDLRREGRDERLAAVVETTAERVLRVQEALVPPDAILVGPRRLRAASEAFARRAHGEMIWFNVCLLMFRPQSLFDALLRPAVENPNVTAIQFVLDDGERTRWQQEVLPKIAACAGREKVREPHWSRRQESVSFILSDTEPGGATEAQLSFWGEPFMARAVGREIPRYIFHVQHHSELIPQLVELARGYRLRE